MSKAEEALDGLPSMEMEVIQEDVGAGRKRIVARIADAGLSFDVLARQSEDDPWRVLATTPFKDVASTVYDCFDGKHRPWAGAWQPRGFNDPAKVGKAIVVIAVGETIQKCLDSFADSIGASSADLSEVVESDGAGDWSVRFSVDGTGFQGWGLCVPGGYAMTGWK